MMIRFRGAISRVPKECNRKWSICTNVQMLVVKYIKSQGSRENLKFVMVLIDF